MDFKGFTKDDINNIQKFYEEDVPRPTSASLQNNVVKIGSKILNKNRNHIKKDFSLVEESATLYPVSPEARLSDSNHMVENNLDKVTKSNIKASPLDMVLQDNLSPVIDSFPKSVTILVGQDKSYEVIESTADLMEELHEVQNKVCLLESSVTSDQNGQTKTSLEIFQERQKQMEEQNKRRKDILTRAIADRKRQTQHEAKKLLQIQDELNKLDALLSTDVAILRNHIEIASVEFNEAQKRYDRAEIEYVDAKVHLFGKLERKELLTEHLCRIIEVNEQRKATKLSQLMAKLELSDDKTLFKDECFKDNISKNTSADGVLIGSCNTFKDKNNTNKTSSSSILTAESNKFSELSESNSLSKETNSLNNASNIDHSLQNNFPHLIKNSLYEASEKEELLTTKSGIKK